MAKNSRRYQLIVYTHMIDRWRPAVFTLGLALLGLAWAIYSWGFESWRWLVATSTGALCVFLSLIMTIIRKSAYVQVFPTYLLIATPLLRLNISYKRFRRTNTSNMGMIFPRNKVSNWQAEIIEPLAKMNAIIIDFTSPPMSQNVMKFFLSPLFFKDKTPHIVLLVEEWMSLSTEIESARSGIIPSAGMVAPSYSSEPAPSAPQQKPRQASNSILSKLPKK